MAKEPIKRRFELTKELEKEYRNAQILPKESIKIALNLDGRVLGDFIKLAQKHPNYYENPQAVKALCQSVLSGAKWALNASEKGFKLIIAPLKNNKADFGGVVMRAKSKNGEHRIRTVLFMDERQVQTKLNKERELGEPILQF